MSEDGDYSRVPAKKPFQPQRPWVSSPTRDIPPPPPLPMMIQRDGKEFHGSHSPQHILNNSSNNQKPNAKVGSAFTVDSIIGHNDQHERKYPPRPHPFIQDYHGVDNDINNNNNSPYDRPMDRQYNNNNNSRLGAPPIDRYENARFDNQHGDEGYIPPSSNRDLYDPPRRDYYGTSSNGAYDYYDRKYGDATSIGYDNQSKGDVYGHDSRQRDNLTYDQSRYNNSRMRSEFNRVNSTPGNRDRYDGPPPRERYDAPKNNFMPRSDVRDIARDRIAGLHDTHHTKKNMNSHSGNSNSYVDRGSGGTYMDISPGPDSSSRDFSYPPPRMSMTVEKNSNHSRSYTPEGTASMYHSYNNHQSSNSNRNAGVGVGTSSINNSNASPQFGYYNHSSNPDVNKSSVNKGSSSGLEFTNNTKIASGNTYGSLDSRAETRGDSRYEPYYSSPRGTGKNVNLHTSQSYGLPNQQSKQPQLQNSSPRPPLAQGRGETVRASVVRGGHSPSLASTFTAPTVKPQQQPPVAQLQNTTKYTWVNETPLSSRSSENFITPQQQLLQSASGGRSNNRNRRTTPSLLPGSKRVQSPVIFSQDYTKTKSPHETIYNGTSPPSPYHPSHGSAGATPKHTFAVGGRGRKSSNTPPPTSMQTALGSSHGTRGVIKRDSPKFVPTVAQSEPLPMPPFHYHQHQPSQSQPDVRKVDDEMVDTAVFQPPLLPLGRGESVGSVFSPHVKHEPFFVQHEKDFDNTKKLDSRQSFDDKPSILPQSSRSSNNGNKYPPLGSPTPHYLSSSVPNGSSYLPNRAFKTHFSPQLSSSINPTRRVFAADGTLGASGIGSASASPSLKRSSHELDRHNMPVHNVFDFSLPQQALSHDAYDARSKEVKRLRRHSSKAVDFHNNYAHDCDLDVEIPSKKVNYTKPRVHTGALKSQMSVTLPSPMKATEPPIAEETETESESTDNVKMEREERKLGEKISKISLDQSSSLLEIGRRVQVDKEGKQIGRVRFLDETGAFVHYEGWGVEYDEWVDLDLVKTVDEPVDDTMLGPKGTEEASMWDTVRETARTLVGHYQTGIVFDASTMKHECTCNTPQSWHPEQPARIAWILGEMDKAKLINRCLPLRSREVLVDELMLVHSEKHIQTYGLVPVGMKLEPGELEVMECGGPGVACDTVYNKEMSPVSAFLAAGCLLEMVQKVLSRDLRNGFAVIRPPGHHAEAKEALGFCFFNNVSVCSAVATKRWGVKKILIVDWDVHHGNGTQNIFYDNKEVMYISLHRHDEGKFYPFTGGPDECGDDDGEGYNINIAWKGKLIGNVEYINAFKYIVMPIAKQFDPDLVIVSAGFDAAEDDPIGGYSLTPECYAHMTRMLMSLAEGKIVLSLEGGYAAKALAPSATACLKTLLGEKLPKLPCPRTFTVSGRSPSKTAVSVLNSIIDIQSKYWTLPKPDSYEIDASMFKEKGRRKNKK
eukprot:CFRG3468T1